MKGAPFVEPLVHSSLSAETQQNIMLRQIVPATFKIGQ